MTEFGLIGRNISYSFSKQYFTKKFENEHLHCSYNNFDLKEIIEFPNILSTHPKLKGLNVTIPYKEEIIPFLDNLSKNAKKIGAVNTIKIEKNGKLKGYNTDFYGFIKSLEPHLKPHHKKALILGTGGASKAVAFALKKLEIPYSFVSRNYSDHVNFIYENLNSPIIASHQIIINCTPLGTYPAVDACPNIPYEHITSKHLLFDLIYNPSETLFLKKGKQHGAQILNGLQMLELQAEKAWKLWNKP
ncbi:shikimate dehydrogenase [Paucihalobacter ruber]|uniref:Shikimate dehydrogenase n=1 Tax=Paucihalobacter ruber TaxID=2567861 RepID=A0A506PKH1_9FLAO|nr:shikimate dehydrogenase [Paucihalobacter ruber]TPV32870.1 shikimate dehydrogenase [Paucihalobacter ruber]